MKRIITAASNNEVVLSSDLFELVKIQGVGMNDTPWTGYRVNSKDKARYYVVEIRLSSRMSKFNGQPIDLEYDSSYIAYGLPNRGDIDIDEFISVLRAAQDFKDKVDDYLGI